ncbi:RNA-directed DNA polymerase from mobile element jockey [Trichonephila clavipes]|nr:RNA-directed DNA polymerase from mobile element jockey [Trichonephila clavipes]
MRRKFDQLQCFAYPEFFTVRSIAKKSQMRQMWQTAPDRIARRCKVKKPILPLSGQQHPANYIGCPNNHLTDHRPSPDANSYPDDIHKIIRKKKTSQIHYPPLLGYRGLVYDTLDKANLFAETLEETFTENPEPYDDDHIEDVERQVRRFFRTTSFQPPPLTSPGEVCEIILDLENKKSPGADQIKNVALKSLPINAITYLTKIFNRCLVNGYFPPAWKHAIITLLPKPGKDAKFATNYRPISLLSTIGKIFEKIILKRLKEHTDNHNLIPDFQHGFRSETSTNHQLLRLTNRVINGFNGGDTTGGAFLDVEKAFDRVWHDGLLYKMIKLNFPSYIIHLVNSYLSDRTFQVKILATLSRIGTVSAGSPQGSILSPLLYNIYTHDFPNTPTVDVCLFADDAAIIAQACNPDMVRRYLQQYLKKLQSWLRKWRIKINVGKSQAIIFKKGQYRNRLRELKLFRNSIPWVRQVEYLGVTLDSKLTFNSHLRKITCKFKRTLYTLLPLLNRSSILSLKSKRLIYLQYLQPTLTYACQIWGCAAQHNLNKLQILQNRTLRLILNYPRFIARRYLHRDS